MWQYYRDEPYLDNDSIVYFTGSNHDSKSFKFKQKITDQTGGDGAGNVEIMEPLKYLSNFW